MSQKSHSDYPTFTHADGTISIYPENAIVERTDSWQRERAFGITNRYTVDPHGDGDFMDIIDTTTVHQYRITHASVGYVLIQLPRGFDTSTLSNMHAPIVGQLWWLGMVIQEKFFLSITEGKEWCESWKHAVPSEVMITLTSANGHEHYNQTGESDK